MSLSKRLNEVVNMVNNCDTACDVGCDHGFVSISLVKNKVVKRALAVDINKGPLEAAESNISQAGLSSEITTRLSDGLHNVTIEDKVDAIIIAGMGGQLIAKILEEGKEVVKGASQLVLGPQSEVFLVRKWLRLNGYTIMKESFVKDMGKFYFIIDARPGKTDSKDEFFDEYSKYLIDTKNALYREYLLKGIETNDGYMKGMSPDKRNTLEEKNHSIKRALSMME